MLLSSAPVGLVADALLLFDCERLHFIQTLRRCRPESSLQVFLVVSCCFRPLDDDDLMIFQALMMVLLSSTTRLSGPRQPKEVPVR